MADIRNSSGIWINTSVFREEATHFAKYGHYCSDPWGSPSWYNYWREQRNRSIFGYEVGGARITGDHYFYLNFCPILKAADTTAKRTKKITDFPDFWDGDYDYFWAREIARNGVAEPLLEKEEYQILCNLPTKEHAEEVMKLYKGLYLEIKIEYDYMHGGWNLIVGKARRRGYSYKNAAVAAKNYFTKPATLTIFGAYEKKFLYPKGIFTMTTNYINFINENTAWIMPSDVLNKVDHIKASYIEYKAGVKVERGFKSEIMALSFKDNPDSARGKDAEDVIIEEAGAFGTPGLLKNSYIAMEDVVKAGDIKTGLITVFGTSGDMEGGTRDYAEMVMNPKQYGMLAMEDIWAEDQTIKKYVGFFHGANKNMEGHYDAQGNSDKEGAKQIILRDRELSLEHGVTSSTLNKKMQERPLNLQEAFAYTTTNIFPTIELAKQRDWLLSTKSHILKGQPVNMFRDPETNRVVTEPDLKGKLEPIRTFNHDGNLEGCPVIYEFPISNAPKGLYKIGYDPVRQDTGTSLASIVVYKGTVVGGATRDIIVAEYIGRKESTQDIHYIAELFAELYNTQVMYENEVPDVKTYFERRKLLKLLAIQPDAVISKNIKKSRTSRVYGCHMNTQLKDAGERYIKDWLLEVIDFDEDGKAITRISQIYSLRFIEELLNYNKDGNYDFISAFIMCMFQVQEEVLGKEYKEAKSSTNAAILKDMMGNMYNRRQFAN